MMRVRRLRLGRAHETGISTMNAFEEEYLEHINEKRCRTGVCSNLRKFQIDPEICKGCSKCARNCPAGAIEGVLKSPYHINQEKCIKCGACMEQCPFKAIHIEK